MRRSRDGIGPGRRAVLTGGGALAALAALGACTGVGATPGTLDALRGGGHVIYFRHTATEWSGNDQHTWPRERQRPLSEKGVADARHIGARFREVGIPVDEVLASPFLRCIDMGEFAFGEVTVEPRLLPPETLGAPPGRLDWMRGRFAEARAGRGNLVMIAHSSNMLLGAGVALSEGEAAVIRPTGEGAHEVIAQMRPSDW